MVDGIAAAYHFRVKYNIKKLPLRYKDLIGIADMLGLTVKSYQDAKDEIRERSLNQYRILPAFTALGIDGTLTIFINDQLPEKERNMALTVQIGHQACGSSIMDIVGRSQFEETTIKQNRNAELFALALLAPFCVFKKLKVKSSSEIAAKAYINDEAARSAWEMVQQCNDKSPGAKAAELCAFMLRREKKSRLVFKFASALLVGMLFFSGGLLIDRAYQTKVNAASSVSQIVYVTPAGRKFHTEQCIYSQGDNVTSLTVKEAKEQGYEPCRFCSPVA